MRQRDVPVAFVSSFVKVHPQVDLRRHSQQTLASAWTTGVERVVIQHDERFDLAPLRRAEQLSQTTHGYAELVPALRDTRDHASDRPKLSVHRKREFVRA